MKTVFQITFFLFLLASCKQNDEVLEQKSFNNFMDWWTYQNKEIDLNSDFDGRTSDNDKISKKVFLDSLKTGKFLPIKIQNKENKNIYFLQKINENETEFSPLITQLAETHIFYLSWENKVFPKFNFKDIEGKNYTSENTKNKTIFLKTYFISCKACNEEMPALNDFIKKNKNNDKLIFLSLALDSSDKLKPFLSTRNYKYHFIANQGNFIKENLHSNQFPTHFVIENGIVKKVFNGSKDLLNYYK